MSIGNQDADSDEAAIAAMDGVVQVHRNPTNWFNNASFALPLLMAVATGVVGLSLRNREVLAFSAFLLVVTLCMVPVVLITWRQTATTVVLTVVGVTSLHSGRMLKTLSWRQVKFVNRHETQGNVRWIIATEAGERLALDGELDQLDRLIETARRLAALGNA